jgi:uncharacterized protein YgfB (UPF0149 family)
LLCGGSPQPEALWLEEVIADQDPGDPLVQECVRVLRGLAADTRERIGGPGMGFAPLLPDDEEPLAARAAALRDWAQGFLYGLGLTGTAPSDLSPESAEALDDLAEIARLDAATASGSEQEEAAYAELAEFVWVAGMLIYEDRVRSEGSAP